jgi:hypothetical protein
MRIIVEKPVKSADNEYMASGAKKTSSRQIKRSKRSTAKKRSPHPSRNQDIAARRKIAAALDTAAFFQHHQSNKASAAHWSVKE